MQTFLPYADLRASCAVLDDRRLGKQRVETFQILRALTWPTYAWKNHPAVTMWRGFVPALVAYGLESCREWTRRGYADTVAPQLLAWGAHDADELPPWFGLEALHLSHRSSLVRKDPDHYRPLFPDAPDDLPYYWPRPAFPRWPVRRRDGAVELHDALTLLGYAEPRPGQAGAVDALVAGRDVLLAMRPGIGGSTTGLLGGLCTPGRTLWVSPPDGPLAGPVPAALVDHRSSSRAPVQPHPTPSPVINAGDGPVARQPGPEDLLAMRDEHAPSEWAFRRPGESAPGSFGLVVLDGVVESWTRPVEAPVLAVVGSAPPGNDLAARLALRDAVTVGGGWDVPGTWLGAVRVGSRPARLDAVRLAIAQHGPAVVVTSTRARAERLAEQLELRAATWAPSMRATAATAAVGAWRTRRLDALVVPAGELPPLGRRQVPLLLHADPPTSADAWREVVEQVAPAAAVLLATPDAADDVLALTAGCVRRTLLARYGELLDGPCGRCSSCAGRPSSC
jgi:hypothetical protein